MTVTTVKVRTIIVSTEGKGYRVFYRARVEDGAVRTLDGLHGDTPEHIRAYVQFLTEVLEAIEQTESEEG